jgi:hypothetical protein
VLVIPIIFIGATSKTAGYVMLALSGKLAVVALADTFAGHEKNNSLIFLSGRRSRRVAADFNGVSFVYRRSAGFLMVKTAHVKTEMVGRAQ